MAIDDSRPEFGKLPLLDGEMLPAGALVDADPDEKRVEEASGNAGVSVELVYRMAALVVWPQAKTVQTLARGNILGRNRIRGFGTCRGRWRCLWHGISQGLGRTARQCLARRGRGRLALRPTGRDIAEDDRGAGPNRRSRSHDALPARGMAFGGTPASRTANWLQRPGWSGRAR